MAIDNTSIGSVLTIPDGLISNLEKVDARIKNIQESARATGATFNTQFAGMTANTNFLINNLDKIIGQLNTIGTAAQTASQATQGMGQGMGSATQGMSGFGTSITNVTQLINQMIGQLQSSGQIGTSQIMAVKLAWDKLQEAMQYKNTGNIAMITDKIKGIDKQLKDTENLLTKTEQDALVERKRLLQEELKEAQRTQKEREVNLQQTLDRMAAAQERYNKRVEQSNKKAEYDKYTTYEGSIKFAESANSINQRLKAIEYLREARAKLTTQDGEYAKKLEEINAAIKRLDKANRDAVASSKNLGTAYESLTKSHHNLLDTAGQLQRAFALIFSVSQIRGYISQIAKVRGEFELQQRSLEAILQNKTQADAIFNKTVALAVQSPFQIKDLISYTKQLAAYRIESDKLYDTTKRLADVSAGLGVDMQRLILAYGQVKAAAYLRGTEVRQFTEAGINLYGELQAYFKEVKGEAYTTAQIVDMISKRMVTFEDVEAIFRRITDQGGIFYNMQAIQAETLQGKIANLKDSIDVMLNDIGKANEGAFKGTIDFANTLIRNWESVANVGKAIIAVFALVKLNSMMMGRTMTEVFLRFSKFQKISSAAKGVDVLSLAFKNVGIAAASAGRMITMAFKANAGLIGITAAVAAVVGFVSYLNDCAEAYRKVAIENGKLSKSFIQISNAFDAASKNNGDKVIDEKEKQLEKLKKLLVSEGLSIKVDIDTEKNVDKYFDVLREKYADFLKFKRTMENALVDNNNDWELFGLFGDNINKDAKDFTDAYNTVIGKTSELDTAVSMLYDRYDKLSDVQKKILDEGTKRQEGQSEVEYLRQQSEAVKKVTELFGATLNTSILRIREYNKNFRYYLFNFGSDNSYDNAKSELIYEINSVVEEAKKSYTKEDWEKVGKDVIKRVITGMANDNNWGDEVKALFYKEFNIPITLDEESAKKEGKRILDLIQDEFNKKKIKVNLKTDLLDPSSALSQIDDITNSVGKWEKLIGNIQRGTMKFWNGAALGINAPTQFKGWKGIIDSATVFSKEMALKFAKQQLEIAKLAKMTVGGQSKEDRKALSDAEKAQRDLIKERIEAYKELQSQYEKYLKMYDKETAKTKALESLKYKLQNAGIYGDAVGIFPDEKTIAEKIKRLAAQYKDLSKRGDAYKIVADLLLQIDQEQLKKELDAAKNQIDDAFNGLNVYTDLKKLGLGESDIAKMFGDLPKTFDDVKKKIAEVYNGKEGEDWAKQREETEKKLQEQVVKYNLDTFKELTKAYKNNLSDQLQLDEWYYEERRKIQENEQLKANPEMQKQYLANLNTKYEKDTQSLLWKNFQGSDMYVHLFDSLDAASGKMLDNMLKRLKSIRNGMKQLDPTELKQVTEQINKIQNIKSSRNPFKALIQGIKEATKAKKEFEALGGWDKYNDLTREKDMLDAVVTKRNEELVTLKQKYDTLVANRQQYSEEGQELNMQIRTNETLLKSDKERLKVLISQIEKMNGVIISKDNAEGKTQESVQKICDISTAAANGILQIMDALGQSSEELSLAINALDNIGQIVGNIYAKNWAGVVSGATGLIGTMINLFSGDSSKQKRIEEQERAIKRLQWAYEDLKEAMDNAMSAADLLINKDDMIDNLNATNASLRSMISMEQSKKHTDSGKIDEWQRQIQENNKAIKELEQTVTEQMGGFGSDSNFKSAAQEFADAWVDAFNEGSDALEALEGKFDDYFNNLLKKQLMMRAADTYIKPILAAFDAAVAEGSAGGNNGLDVTEEELNRIKELKDTNLALFDEYAKGLMDILGVSPTTSASLSDLQQGIQSLSESTGQALESLLNSIRFFVAQQSTDVAAIRQLLAAGSSLNTTTDTNTPMLKELQAQTNYLSKMYSLWSSVIKSGGHPKAGAGIKVFQD